MAGKFLLRSICLFFLGCCLNLNLAAQQDTSFYRLKFTDKTNTPFSIQNPEAFLSVKAIERRENQNIVINERDLPIDPNYVAQILSFSSTHYVTHSKWFNQLVITCDDTNDINIIKNFPFVESSEKVMQSLASEKSGIDKLSISSPKTSVVVNPHYPYGKTYAQNHLHEVDYMHDLGFNGQGVDIAVIDAGFENVNTLNGLSHLFETGQILSTYDFVNKEISVSEDHYHGSAVLSLMAGYIPGEFYGTAISANYHLLRSEDANGEYIIEEDFWVRAAEYADSAGCDIINTSLGYTTFDDSTQNHTYAEMDGNTTLIARASDLVCSKGILCVTSAGNLGDSNWGYISTPADADSVLTIGAIDIDNNIASFSSFGPSADNDLKPNLVSVGWNAQLIAPWDNQIIQGNGTSFSAPMVSGMAACLWQALPSLNNMELKTLLEETASETNQPDTIKGYGYPRIFEAYSSKTGITHQNPDGIKIQKLYPNPLFRNTPVYLLLGSNEDTEVEVLLIDITGQIVMKQAAFLNAGINLVTLPDGFSIASGIYSIVVQNSTQMSLKKIVVN